VFISDTTFTLSLKQISALFIKILFAPERPIAWRRAINQASRTFVVVGGRSKFIAGIWKSFSKAWSLILAGKFPPPTFVVKALITPYTSRSAVWARRDLNTRSPVGYYCLSHSDNHQNQYPASQPARLPLKYFPFR